MALDSSVTEKTRETRILREQFLGMADEASCSFFDTLHTGRWDPCSHPLNLGIFVTILANRVLWSDYETSEARSYKAMQPWSPELPCRESSSPESARPHE